KRGARRRIREKKAGQGRFGECLCSPVSVVACGTRGRREDRGKWIRTKPGLLENDWDDPNGWNFRESKSDERRDEETPFRHLVRVCGCAGVLQPGREGSGPRLQDEEAPTDMTDAAYGREAAKFLMRLRGRCRQLEAS
ncbi:hypothetical protein GQ607_015061, partial [Colletotrichum asianum]